MPRLVRRNGVFYFRMAVPKPLVPALRRSEAKTTLRTGDVSIARSRARRLSEALETLFGELGTMPDTTFEIIDARVREYMQASLGKGLELARLMPGDTVDTNAEVIGLQDDIERLRRQLIAQSFAPDVVSTARSLLTQSHPDPAFQSPDAVQHASEGVARARIENARILVARLKGKHDEAALRDPLFAGLKTNALPPLPGETSDAPAPVLTFRALGDRYLAHVKKAGNQEKTLGDHARSLRLAYAVRRQAHQDRGQRPPRPDPSGADLCRAPGSCRHGEGGEAPVRGHRLRAGRLPVSELHEALGPLRPGDRVLDEEDDLPLVPPHLMRDDIPILDRLRAEVMGSARHAG